MADETVMCSVRVYRGHWAATNKCGRAAKGKLDDGKPACGLHLSAARRATEKLAAENERIALAKQDRAKVNTITARLERHGVIGTYWRGGVLLSAAEAESLAEMLDFTGLGK